MGVLVGLDLVSVPQAMTSRPLVAARWRARLGDPAAGLRLGAVLELFALETLPVGAARYPDWGRRRWPPGRWSPQRGRARHRARPVVVLVAAIWLDRHVSCTWCGTPTAPRSGATPSGWSGATRGPDRAAGGRHSCATRRGRRR